MKFTARARTFLFLILFAGAAIVHASEGAVVHNYAGTFLWIAILLLVARFASLVERIGQPSVLGELVIGVVLGNLALVGIPFFAEVTANETIVFLAELGVVILLFQIGLESNVQKMRAVGFRALLVAIVGVVLPFLFGTVIAGPLLLPGESLVTYLFLGAALTATSVGITARVFQDFKKLDMPEAQIVLGAAVIDDVLGLIILAVISAIATTGTVSMLTIAWITGKALLFLICAIVLGQSLAPVLGKLFSKIHTGVGMKFTLVISFCLVFAAIAQFIGLAPIVGAFAAGLVLDPVHFQYFKDPHIISDITAATDTVDTGVRERIQEAIRRHADRHIEELIEPLGLFLVPLFFVVTGMGVRLETFAEGSVLLVALGITAIAFIGKIAAGFVAGDVRKWLVGWGMVPRGEVGLIFASIGKTLGVVSDSVFSVIVIVIILTTLCTPPMLAKFLREK